MQKKRDQKAAQEMAGKADSAAADTTLLDTEPETRFRQLFSIIERLRSPGGCPWDRAQTLESMRSCLLEECWEVVDAVNRRDFPQLREELGDLLLNVLLLCDIAHREIADPTAASSPAPFNGEHFLAGVLEDLCNKLVRRHPHVFGDSGASNAEEALRNWQQAKEAEKGGTESLLAGIHADQTALLYALKLQKKAAKAGFDWPAATAAEETEKKLREELAEWNELLSTKIRADEPALKVLRKRLEEELGDILFSVVNLARVQQINPELALGRSSEKFRKRFEHIERRLAEWQLVPQDSSLEQMEALWQEAKAKERKGDLQRGPQ